MKNIFIISLLTIFTGCYLIRDSPEEKLAMTRCQGIYTNLDSANACADFSKKLTLIAVFPDQDTALYHAPITKALKLDSIEDKSYIKMLSRDYVVVKLFYHELKQRIKSITKDQYNEAFINTVTNNTKTLFFITGTSYYVLHEWDLTATKEQIMDNIAVGAGP